MGKVDRKGRPYAVVVGGANVGATIGRLCGIGSMTAEGIYKGGARPVPYGFISYRRGERQKGLLQIFAAALKG